jgi:hypothetical protein
MIWLGKWRRRDSGVRLRARSGLMRSVRLSALFPSLFYSHKLIPVPLSTPSTHSATFLAHLRTRSLRYHRRFSRPSPLRFDTRFPRFDSDDDVHFGDEAAAY